MKKVNSMIDKMISLTNSQFCNTLSESTLFNTNDEDLVITDCPMLNVVLSGKIDKGLYPGTLMIAGESKRFKSNYGVYLVSEFLKKYETGFCLFYDSELGIKQEYVKNYNLDMDRVVHIPMGCLENFRHDLKQKIEHFKGLSDEERNSLKVIIFIDSIGNMHSRKEADDALEGKEKADMTRAKTIKSIFRIITLDLQILKIPMIVINHTYKSQDAPNPKYAEEVISGGSGIMLSSDTALIIKRKQEKEEDDIVGYEFTIIIAKSRFVKEKSRIPINVRWENGIQKYSGLLDLAEEFGLVEQVKNGRLKQIKCGDKLIDSDLVDNDSEFWKYVFENTDLKEKISKKYSI